MVLLGVAWASMMGVPYIMVASMVPKERLGVYMGIVNMMIVVPMLIQTVTFGWIFENVLGCQGTNAIIFSGILFAIGGVAMLWVNPPQGDGGIPDHAAGCATAHRQRLQPGGGRLRRVARVAGHGGFAGMLLGSVSQHVAAHAKCTVVVVR